MAYRPDIQRQVHESLTDFADEHDIDAIVDEILDRYGDQFGKIDGIEEVPDEEYWEIVQRHAR